MKKVLSFILALALAVSIIPVFPAFAADNTITLTATKSMTANLNSKSITDTYSSSYPASSLYIYHSNWNQRNGYVGFDLSNAFTAAQLAEGPSIVNATLTVNVAQAATVTQPEVTLFAIDNTAWDESTYPEPATLVVPEYNITSTTTTVPDKAVIVDTQSITKTGKVSFDVTDYMNENYRSLVDSGVSFAIAHVNTTTTGNSEAIKILIEGKTSLNAPTLTIKFGEKATVNVFRTTPDVSFGYDTVTGFYSGDDFTPDESIAPLVIATNTDSSPKYYLREELTPVTLSAGENIYNVDYTEVKIDPDTILVDTVLPVIEGGTPALPKTITATTTTGVTAKFPVEWSEMALKDVDYVRYRAPISATGSVAAITKDVAVLSCDSKLNTFNSSGESSNGASFSTYNDLALSVGGGTVIFDAEFITTDGTNKLICYGDGTTSGFSGCGALMRMFATEVDGSYVFEYHDGDWTPSSVVCEYGVNYVLRCEIDVTSKTYSLYISADGGSYETVCEDAAFRNSSLTTIDRMFFSGTMTMKSHLGHWKDGYSMITVSPVDEKGDNVADNYTLKCTTGSTYTASYLPKLLEQDGNLYIMEDVNYAPSIKVTGDSTFKVRYNEVTLASYDNIVTVLVQGDSTINLPGTVKLTFSDGQTVTPYITWDTSSVVNDVVGEYVVTGAVEGLNDTTIEATVKVREVTLLPKTTTNTVATNNGGWNWYVEPSGTHIQPGDALATRYESGLYSSNNGYVFEHDKTYMGWVEDEGTIVVAEYDHDNDTYKRVELHPFLESDDHNNPAVVVLPDGRIMVFYSMHTNEPYMYYCVTKNPEDISEWHDWQRYYCYTEADSRTYNATYPSVFIVHDDEGIIGNDVIYVGWRGVHWKPTFAKFSIPDENGVCEMIMKQTQFANTTYGYSTYDGNDAPNAKTDGGYTDSGRRPYTKYDYDFERNKIYITFTANHPDNDKRNHIYYIYLDIEDQNLYTAKDNLLQPLPKENNASYKSQGANGTNGQWGIITVDLVDTYPELLVFNASEQTGQSFNPRYGDAERRGWTWDIKVNEKGEPCIVYVDVTATPPNEDGSLPTKYLAAANGNSRSHHYYWYARWDSDTQQWVKTFLTYGGKWFHENATQERCYSGGLTFDHNASDANVIYLSIPTMGEYGNIFEIYRWESEDHGATWTIREPLTENSKINNARPNAIYNYKQDEDGNHQGPRLLWISGEYRYWMNYEYKTGVMTDWSADGFITQDSPEMFADAHLYADGEMVDTLPVGENVNLTGKFNITNISIGDGEAYFALVHYSSEGALKNVVTTQETIPARSVPQIGMIGAPKMEDDSLSTMGDEEVLVEIEYTSDIAEGDSVKLLAWNAGIEHPMSSIISVPFAASTEGNKYLMTDTFTYDGTEKLILDEDTETFNGWISKAYGSSSASIGTRNYAAITKAPFGNTGLHLYHMPNESGTGSGGIMASHALPDTEGRDYTIRFTMRFINEMSWNDTNNAGFTLSHGTPVYNSGNETPCALQFRHRVVWQEENGRGTSGHVRNTRWFDGGSMTQIFVETDGPDGVGFKNDALMVGALYTVEINVHPADRTIDFSINDGHRTFYVNRSYVDATSFDWDSYPIDTITFSLSRGENDDDDKDENGEIYIDNFSVEIAE